MLRRFSFKTNILDPSYHSIKYFVLQFFFPEVVYAAIIGQIRILLASEMLRDLILRLLLTM